MRTTCWDYLLGRKRRRQAVRSSLNFAKAVRLRPDFAQAYNNLGLVLTQTDDDPGAIAAFREAIRISPDYADAHANLGAALIPTDANKPSTNSRRRFALAPASVKAQFNLATAYGTARSTVHRKRSNCCAR